ncbi:LysR family transcriptional regulator [soil metagenome]
MDIGQLAVLRELSARGSITDVAIATHKSPSAVSQQLKTLQRQVGVVLIERSGRGVRLTDAGKALAESSVRIATAMAEAEATWASYRGGQTGIVRLSAFPSAAELLLPGLLARMRAHPDITLRFEDRDVSQDEFSSLTSDFDLVLAHRSDDVLAPDRPSVESVQLFREPLDIALPLRHPLASRERVTIGDVISEDWISVAEGYPIDRVLQTMAVHADKRPNIVHRSIHLPLIENLVAAGHGIALVPRYTSRQRAEGRFAIVPLSNVRAGRLLEVLMRPDRAPRAAVRAVLAELVTEAADVTAR